MANSTFTKIDTVTVGSGGASTIVFGSGGTLPQTYTDFMIKVSARSNRSGVNDVLIAYYNGSNSSITGRRVEGVIVNGSAFAGADTFVIAGYVNGNTSTGNTFAASHIYITNYTSTSRYKTLISDAGMEQSGTSGVTAWGWTTNIWASTSAINQITLAPYYGSAFLEYTTATLYGITKQ